MASLIIQTDGRCQAGVITGRVLIGRKPFNTIALDHPAVSRIHAWIERRDGQFWIGDCGGRNGTYVNGVRIDRLVALRDGDEIHIARTSILFRDSDDLPARAEPIRLEQADDRLMADHSGFLIDCACGAPTWAPNFLAGRERKCGHCGQMIRIPAAPVAQRPAVEAKTEEASTAASRIVCSICQCPIGPGDQRTQCPGCGLEFHTECWEENLGCSAYGCSQVNALDPDAKAAQQAVMPPPVDPAVEEAAVAAAAQVQAVPWEYVLLGGSVLGAALGVLAFGLPSLALAMAGSYYLAKAPRDRRMIVLAGLALSLAGLATGVIVSYLWWLR